MKTQTDLKKYIPLDKVKTRANWGQLEFLLDDLLDLPEVKEFLTQKRNELINAFEEMLVDDRFDDLDNNSKLFTQQDMELIAVHMRNKLRQELREKLNEMRKE